MKIFDLVRLVNFFILGLGRAKYGLGLENLRYKSKFFNWDKKYPGQRRVSLLFTAGQKCARVGSGPILPDEFAYPVHKITSLLT